MTFSNLPQREVTPEERKRSTRMFWVILLLFPMAVGVMVAYLSVKGRQIRDYGQEVLAAAQLQHFDQAASYFVSCAEYLKKPLPQGVAECKVQVVNGQPQVEIQNDRGQQYQISKSH